ncbi:hypothetical protein CNYM01_03718 [Colletotrichum nymphaeae SA-01]|uniref:Uncharacterized protein n=1 Tax=Colletotrichum nymphaeae SA-01 TaxID=1460502 RepID=A0A135UR76_9PEZI|nr:hypothetical protein CNYM01_03718 [Colletotrichum nymphaeae SA-01]
MGTDIQSPSMSARYVGIQNPDLADYPCEAVQFRRKHSLQHRIPHAPLEKSFAAWRHLSALSHRKASGQRIYPPIASRENQFSLGNLKVCIGFTSSRAAYALRVHLKNEDAAMARLAGQALGSKNPSLPWEVSLQADAISDVSFDLGNELPRGGRGPVPKIRDPCNLAAASAVVGTHCMPYGLYPVAEAMLSSGRWRFFSPSPLQRHNPKEFNGQQHNLCQGSRGRRVWFSSWRICFLFTPRALDVAYLLVGGLRIGSPSVGVSHAGARIRLTLEDPEILSYTPPLINARPSLTGM